MQAQRQEYEPMELDILDVHFDNQNIRKAFHDAKAIFSRQNKINLVQKEKMDEFLKRVSEHNAKHNAEHKDLKSEIKKDLLVELATKADIEGLKGAMKTLEASTKADNNELKGAMEASYNELKGAIEANYYELKGAIEANYSAMKADYNELKGAMKTEISELKGAMNTLEATIKGEMKRDRQLLKILIGLALIAITIYSPAAVELLKLLK